VTKAALDIQAFLPWQCPKLLPWEDNWRTRSNPSVLLWRTLWGIGIMCCNWWQIIAITQQVAQLSQRNYVMLHVIVDSLQTARIAIDVTSWLLSWLFMIWVYFSQMTAQIGRENLHSAICIQSNLTGSACPDCSKAVKFCCQWNHLELSATCTMRVQSRHRMLSYMHWRHICS